MVLVISVQYRTFSDRHSPPEATKINEATHRGFGKAFLFTRASEAAYKRTDISKVQDGLKNMHCKCLKWHCHNSIHPKCVNLM